MAVKIIKVDTGIERRALELKQNGLKALDAVHVACAEKAKADVFLTTDDYLLNKASQNKKLFRLKIENPLKWTMEVFI